jgi:hypothetical protein
MDFKQLKKEKKGFDSFFVLLKFINFRKSD